MTCSDVEPLRRDGLDVDAVELALVEIGVVAFELLLGLQLLAVVGQLLNAALAVLAGARLATVEGALGPAPDVLTQAAVDLVLGANALGHVTALQWLCVAWSAPSSVRGNRRSVGPTGCATNGRRRGCAIETRAIAHNASPRWTANTDEKARRQPTPARPGRLRALLLDPAAGRRVPALAAGCSAGRRGRRLGGRGRRRGRSHVGRDQLLHLLLLLGRAAGRRGPSGYAS